MYRLRPAPLLLLVALALVASLAAGCRPDPPAVTVLGTPFTREELRALPQTSATFGGRTARGVSLQALLEASGVEAETVALVAREGYAASVPVVQLDARAVLSYGERNTLDAVIPSLPASAWVRDVVEIVDGGAAGDPLAAGMGPGQGLSTPTAVPTAVATAAATAAPATTTPAASPPLPGTTPPPLADGPLELEDSAGRPVTLEALPARLVVAGPDAHMVLHLLAMFPEALARLVGAETPGGTADPFLSVVNPAYAAVALLPEGAGAQAIAALAPDMVLLKRNAPGSAPDEEAQALQAALEAAGIATFTVDLETMLAFERDVANLGALLGNAERAGQIIAAYRGWLDEVDARLSDGTLARPGVLVLRWRGGGTGGDTILEEPGAAAMQAAQVVRVCGEPAWVDGDELADAWTPVTVADIARWDPDLIAVAVPHPHDRVAVIEALAADPAWAALGAVQDGRLYAYPRDLFGWDDANPRWILGVQWLATRVHPELFTGLDPNATVRAWCRTLYGLPDATIDRAILPNVETDNP